MDKHPRKKDEEKKEETKKFFNMLHDLFEKIVPNLASGNSTLHPKKIISPGAIAYFLAVVERANFFGADFNDYFFETDAWFMKALHVTRMTIKSYREELTKAKLIYCIPGKHKGLASYYFIPYPYNPKRRDDPMKKLERRERNKAKLLRQAREWEQQQRV